MPDGFTADARRRDDRGERPTTRRGALAGLCGALCGLAAAGGRAAADPGRAPADGLPGPAAFRVEGRERRRTKIRPDAVTVTVRKTAPALKRRYDLPDGELSKTRRFDRPAPAEDDLPRRDVRVENRPWEAHVAAEDEWAARFEAAASSPTTQARAARETDYPFGVYEYERLDGLYERAAPMNVISRASLSGVVDTLDADGYTTYVVQYDRSAWNSEAWQFETQHASAATGTFGFLGRKHAKFWSFGGYVSCSAHVDDAVPHEAVSFDEAEAHIEGVFDDAAGWYGLDDYYALFNGTTLDHDGYSTRLFR